MDRPMTDPNTAAYQPNVPPCGFDDSVHDKNTQNRMDVFDGIRGLAAFGVFVGHWVILFNPPRNFLAALSVLLFFSLSAFLMCHITHGKDMNLTNLKDFFVRRFSRVMPLFMFVVTFLYLIHPFEIFGISLAILGMYNLQQLFEHLILFKTHNYLWTIPVEVSFYILFPAFWAINKSDKIFLIVIFLLLFHIHIVMFWIPGFWGPGPFDHLPTALRLRSYLPFFLIGIMAYMVYRATLDSPTAPNVRVYDLGFIGSAVGICVSLPPIREFLTGRTNTVTYDRVLMAFLLIFFMTAPFSRIALQTFGNAFMKYMGKISYSVYLWHLPILFFFDRANKADSVLALPASLPINFAMMAAIVIAVSHASYHLIERPCQRFINRLFSRR